MTRRAFLLCLAAFGTAARRAGSDPKALVALDRPRVVRAANRYLRERPVTITAASSPRSAGGRHDYFSEGDYWWPDPANPTGPYIQRDGLTNPDNFIAHRRALIRLSLHVPALAAAWRFTHDRRYTEHAARHLRAWFLDEQTRMNPNLRYAQAIHGRVTGRGVGIIDTVHLVEVVRSIGSVEESGVLPAAERDALRGWFAAYLTWMTSHPYGQEERDARNNHATCWVAQVAEFARYTANPDLMEFCRARFRTVLLPNQLAGDGSFPLELARTKPYGYSLFNLDAMATVCQILSTADQNLWAFELPDGRGMRKALAFMAPYIADKRKWPFAKDVMYFDGWPIRHPSLLFGGVALDEPRYVELWKRLDPDPTIEEIIRNYFVRQPVLWL